MKLRGENDSSNCETIKDPVLWGITFSDKIGMVLIERGASSSHNGQAKYPTLDINSILGGYV